MPTPLELRKEVRELTKNPDTSYSKKVVLEDVVSIVDVDDGGRAMVASIEGDDPNSGFFVELRSWSEILDHGTIKSLLGRKVRVTVETIE